jgi:hypothetical protein
MTTLRMSSPNYRQSNRFHLATYCPMRRGVAPRSRVAVPVVGCIGLASDVYSSSLEMSLLVSELLVGSRETLL